MLNRVDGGWWRGVVLLAALLVLVTLPGMALQTTTVHDTVYRADGTPAQGTVLLSWSAFTAADGSAVAAGNETLTIGANGALSVALTPNAGATPLGSYYTAVYHLNDGTVQKEYWVVPQGGTTTLSAIRSNVVPAAVAQTWSSQASISAALSAMQTSFLPLKGGTVSGPITLPADPSAGLQAATKQYVDSRTSLPANAIPYQGSTGAGVVAATFDKIVAPFHSTVYVNNTVTDISTAFNERAAGAGLIGTSPATDVPGSSWMGSSGSTTGGGVFVSGGGAQFGPANGGGTAITLLDTGKADFTWTLSSVHLSGSASGGFQIYARANNPVSAAEVIQWSPGGIVTIQDATGGGSPAVVASAQTSGLSGDIVVTLSGQTISVNWFGTVISGTIPTTTNSGNTFIGFNPNGSLGNTNDWAMTARSMTVSVSGPMASTVACNGIVQSDGTCGTVAPNQGVATDASGHATHLPEVQYSTDSAGNTTIACQEDHDRGIFDPRCSRVEKIDGNNTVVTIYSSPALALQETANEANCWVAKSHRAATINLPPGNFKVGLPTEQTLTFGPGQHILGSPSGAVGVGGASNEGGTVFNATYTNAYVVQVISPYTSTCADGTTATNGMDGGDVENVQATGCTNGGCINAPGDTNTYGGGGPNQGGVYVGLAHGVGRNLRAAYTGGIGVNANGLDSEFWDMWSYSALGYYRYDRSPINGTAYSPSTDGIHGGVELNALDGRFHHIETYGSFTAPGTSGVGASEYGHVCGVVINGGNSTVDDIFEQIDEVGVCKPYGGSRVRISNIRAEGNAGPSLFNQDSDTLVTQGVLTQGCTVQAVVTQQGFCDDLEDVSVGGGAYVNLKIRDDPHSLGTSYRTGFISPGKATFYGVDQANGDGFDKTFAGANGDEIGINTQVAETDPAVPFGGAVFTGSSPDIGAYHRIRMQNGSPTNITDVTNPTIGQALHITLASANDVLVAKANGGAWQTCAAQNIAGPAGPMTFWVFDHGATHTIAEECDPLPASAVTNAADKSSVSPQAFNGPILAPEFGNIEIADGEPLAGCRVNSTFYPNQAECAIAKANNYVTTTGNNALVEFLGGTYQNCGALTLAMPAANNAAVSIQGMTYGSTTAAGVTIQQSKSAGCNTTLPVINQAGSTANIQEQVIKGITIDGNHVVECADLQGTRRSEYDFTCNNPLGDHGVLLSNSTTLGYEYRKSRITVRTAAYGGTVTYPSVTPVLTSGAVSGWTVNSGGSFPSYYQLTAQVYGECTTIPSNPTVQTSVSGGTLTVIGLTTGASAGAGCTSLYVQVYEQPEVNHCIVLNTTDSTYEDLVCAGVTFSSGIQNLHGNNTFIHPHSYGHNPVQFEDHGKSTIVGLECDSAGGVCLQLMGSHTLIYGMSNTWNGASYPGAGDIFIGAGASDNALFGHTCPGTQTAGGYVEINTASGPFVPGPGKFPPGLTLLGPNQLCDGSGLFGGNFVSDSFYMGGVNASKLNIYSNPGAASYGVGVGDGTNVSNIGLYVSSRATFGFNATTQGSVVGGKAVEFECNAASFGTGICGGFTITSMPYKSIGTAIASAATIAPSGAGILHITGTATISTMTPPTGCTTTGLGCRITLWPDGAWTIATGGNFAHASTAAVGKPMDCTYDPTPAKWGCSY